MNLQSVIDGFYSWIECVAATIVAGASRLRRPLKLRLIEEDKDSFRIELPPGNERLNPGEARLRIVDGTVAEVSPAVTAALRGSQAEMLLRADRFLFRPLDVPQRAADFLGGIVRAQIDRITPWSAQDAAFGWAVSGAPANERIALSVCATARAFLMPYVNALTAAGVESLAIATSAEAGAAPIKVLEKAGENTLNPVRLQRYLSVALLAAGFTAALSMLADQFLGAALDDQKAELQRNISRQRAMIRHDGLPGESSALQLLSQRKHETASSVIVLEALSKILPDHTYVTELRIEGDKMQLNGVTLDAPSLIGLIEQSPIFTRATFFAPTTSTAGEPREQFHIEAQLKPVFPGGT